jgi:hypothetical protein
MVITRKETDEQPMQEPKEAPKSTAYLENPQTNTFSFVLKTATRSEVVPHLTLDDRRALAASNPPLMNEVVTARAKQIFAAGGRIKDIAKGCNISPDYAAKIHAAFTRKKNAIAKKRSKQQ